MCEFIKLEQATLCAGWIKNNRRLERIVHRSRTLSCRIAQFEQVPAR